jgi:hypothetical protein
MRHCEQHCQCPHCKGSCLNKPIIQPGKARWCRRCRKYKCQQVRKRLVDGRKPCQHEGCTEPAPCTIHCQCKRCFPCGNFPVGESHNRPGFLYICKGCRWRFECGKGASNAVGLEQAQAMEVDSPLQQTVMPVVRRDVIRRYTVQHTQVARLYVVPLMPFHPAQDLIQSVWFWASQPPNVLTFCNAQGSVAAASSAVVQRLLRRLRPEKPPSPEEIMLASFRAGGPNYPLSMVIAGLTDEGV